MGFPGDSDGKESACNTGDLGWKIPGLERPPGGGHGNPLWYSCLENPHGQRNLAGDSPWGRKESHVTEQLSKGTYHEDEPLNYIYLDSLATGRILQTESRMTGKM